MRESEWWRWKERLTAALIATEHVEACSASGKVDAAVKRALRSSLVGRIADELHEGEPHLVRELRETGAWSREDLEDHRANLERIVWLLACEWREGNS